MAEAISVAIRDASGKELTAKLGTIFKKDQKLRPLAFNMSDFSGVGKLFCLSTSLLFGGGDSLPH